MKSKAKARVKSTEIGCSVKSTIHKNVIKKRKPAEKTTRSNSGSRKSTKNVSPKDLAGKNEIQANNLPMRRVAWVLNSVGDASRDTTGGSTDDNMNEDLQDIPDHLGRKSCLKKIMPKIESEGQSRKKRASEQSDYNMDTMEDAGSSGISASTKESVASRFRTHESDANESSPKIPINLRKGWQGPSNPEDDMRIVNFFFGFL
ncbi:hypothetical protein ACH3XW_46845 [Acanthocheilonema viteae]